MIKEKACCFDFDAWHYYMPYSFLWVQRTGPARARTHDESRPFGAKRVSYAGSLCGSMCILQKSASQALGLQLKGAFAMMKRQRAACGDCRHWHVAFGHAHPQSADRSMYLCAGVVLAM